MFVLDFIKGLFTSRISGAQMSVTGKAYSAQSRVKSKVANTFNKAVDGSLNKAKGGVEGAVSGKEPKADPDKGKKKMGFLFFGKKGGKKAAPTSSMPAVEEGEALDAKTQAINIGQFEDTNFKACVGWVVIIDGVQKGWDFRLTPGRNRIGTDADMEVVLTDPYVSSHHATIAYTDEGVYQLSDAGSTNGTRLNGKRVMQAVIVDNDSITIGHTQLKFKALD